MRRVVRQKWLKMGLVAVTFGLVFSITYTFNRAYIKNNTDLVTVVVAARRIPAYSLIEEGRLTLAPRPRSVVPGEAVRSLADLAGKRYYTGELGLGEGDILRLDRVAEKNNTPVGNLMTLAAENKMLVSVNTNLVKSCANQVVPGTLVNAVVFIKGEMVNAPDQVISPAEDARLGHLLVVDKKNAESAPPPERGREAIPAVVTLVLDNTDLETAKALVQYNEKGSVYLLPIGFQGDVYLAAQSLAVRE